jgi:ABC-type polysaccharide/polyol phosphate transport system ATPase subunit
MNAVVVRQVVKDYRIYPRGGGTRRSVFAWPRGEVKRALRDISFEMPVGECLGVIGDNGCGKSTLLRLLARISRPTSGEIEVNGRVSYLLDPTVGFNPDFTGRQNVYMKCALLGLSGAETDELLPSIHEFAGLAERLDHPIKTYSAGMLVRLGFAVAIHLPFDILLVDEVLSVGDYIFQRKCVGALKAFQLQGKTIVIASHSLAEIAHFCDRVLLLDDGAGKLLGPTESVLQAYMRDCESRGAQIEKPEFPLYDDLLSCCEQRVEGARIDEVAFLDAHGEPAAIFDSGAPLTLRLRFTAHAPIDNPCVRLQFWTNHGVFVFGSNTYRHELELGRLHGSYEALCRIPRLNLLAGDYFARVGVWPDEYRSFAAKAPYDVHEFKHVIAVRSARADGGGVARLDCAWSVKPLEGP